MHSEEQGFLRSALLTTSCLPSTSTSSCKTTIVLLSHHETAVEQYTGGDLSLLIILSAMQ